MKGKKIYITIAIFALIGILAFTNKDSSKSENAVKKEITREEGGGDKEEKLAKEEVIDLDEARIGEESKILEKVLNASSSILEERDGLVQIEEDGIIYLEEATSLYGIDQVEVMYILSGEDKIIAIQLKFPDNVSDEEVEARLREELGEEDTNKKDGEDFLIEWINEDRSVFRYEKYQDNRLLLITII